MPVALVGGLGGWGWGVAQNCGSGTTKDHLSSNFWAEDFNAIIFLIIRIICINRLQEKFHRKIKEMLNYSLAC